MSSTNSFDFGDEHHGRAPSDGTEDAFSKLRLELETLRMSLADERARNDDQRHVLDGAETKLRRLADENESLTFRNGQLIKRVEALQTALDNYNAVYLMAKNKKKHKEANLRLFGESSRQQAFNPVDSALVMEQELERKLTENSELHSKIFDMERQHESITADLTGRIEQLERENVRLKRLIEMRGVCAPRRPSPDSRPSSSARTENETHGNASSNATNASLVDDTLIDASTVYHFNFDENRLMENHFFEKVEDITASLRHATSRAEYYKQECECLIQRSIVELEDKRLMEQQITDLNEKCSLLNESLETTRQNYESQMRGLYEHMAEQDARIVEQSERLSGVVNLNNNGDCDTQDSNGDGNGNNSRKSSMKRDNSSSIRKNLRRIVGK